MRSNLSAVREIALSAASLKSADTHKPPPILVITSDDERLTKLVGRRAMGRAVRRFIENLPPEVEVEFLSLPNGCYNPGDDVRLDELLIDCGLGSRIDKYQAVILSDAGDWQHEGRCWDAAGSLIDGIELIRTRFDAERVYGMLVMLNDEQVVGASCFNKETLTRIHREGITIADRLAQKTMAFAKSVALVSGDVSPPTEADLAEAEAQGETKAQTYDN